MDKITIAVISLSGLLIAVGIIISLTAGGTAAQQQQQSFAQIQELTESSLSDFFNNNNHGYIVRLYEFR